MTMIAATITRNGAVLTQDTMVYEGSPEYQRRVSSLQVTSDFYESLNSCYPGGSDPNAITVLGHVMKVMPVPRFCMAIAGTGSLRLLAGWYFGMMTIPARDITELNKAAPQALRNLREELQIDDGTIVIHAGYSAQLGRGAGFTYASGQDFTPVEIPLGSTLSPSPDPTDLKYAEIAELWANANRGERVTDLHAALMAQQWRAFVAGKMGAGAAIGGDLNHVIVHPGGIDIRTAFAA